LLEKKTTFERIICTDYDTNAIDKLYRYLCDNEITKIIPAIVDVNQQIKQILFDSNEKRFQSDLVCALAITHHLFLSQGLSYDYVFSIIRNYSRKYVAIEFMPLGLYTPKYDDALALPDWYTEEWFARKFEIYFEKISRTVLEKNRILYIGKVLD